MSISERYVSAEDVINDIRRIGRDYGYAVGLHGSLRSTRDIDLIACPWTSRSRAMSSLVKAILALPYLTPNPNMKLPVRKAHGRRAWALLIKWRKAECPAYVDLSVLPVNPPVTHAPAQGRDVGRGPTSWHDPEFDKPLDRLRFSEP